jgi:hypothetical protein
MSHAGGLRRAVLGCQSFRPWDSQQGGLQGQREGQDVGNDDVGTCSCNVIAGIHPSPYNNGHLHVFIVSGSQTLI